MTCVARYLLAVVAAHERARLRRPSVRASAWMVETDGIPSDDAATLPSTAAVSRCVCTRSGRIRAKWLRSLHKSWGFQTELTGTVDGSMPRACNRRRA